MRIRSLAKVNLGLEVLGRRPDGYHEIRTLFQTIDLHDELEFSTAPPGVFRLEGDDPAVPWDESNLIARAYRAVLRESGRDFGLEVRVRKSIPAGRGLGGGSSNAAVTLLALDRLWGLGLGQAALERLAVSLGADVPFFLHGGLCLGEGIGERITELPDTPETACLVAWPDFGVDTASAYQALGPALTSSDKASKIKRFLDTGSYGHLENELEPVVAGRHPEIAGLKTLIQETGAALVLMSGSGSAVFGLFRDRAAAVRARRIVSGRARTFLARTVARDEYRAGLSAGVSPSW